MVHKYCQDPLKKYKRQIKYTNQLWTVTQNLSKLVKGKLEVGSLLCINCFKSIKKDPNQLINAKIHELQLEEVSSSSCLTDSPSSSSCDNMDSEVEDVQFKEILEFNGASPLKTGKLISYKSKNMLLN